GAAITYTFAPLCLSVYSPPSSLFFCFFFFSPFFFFNDTATTEIYTLSLHDALPLLRLQWLVILLLIAALLWLFISQQRFEHSINERLQSNEQVVSRLNEMDDRIFAMSQQTLPEPRVAASSQAQNQLDLLRIQIQA